MERTTVDKMGAGHTDIAPVPDRTTENNVAALNILTPEELAERSKRSKSAGGRRGRRRSEDTVRSIEAYKAKLLPAELGDSADVELEPGETKARVREHLKLAAAELDRALEFRQIKDPTRLHFRLVTPEECAARPKGGRRSKNPQSAPASAQPQASMPVEDHAA